MRIGIDIRVLSRGTRTGIEEYTLNLLSCLLFSEMPDDYFLFYNAYRKVPLNYSWLNFEKVTLKQFRIPNRFFFLSARYFNLPKVDKLLGGLDVYFNPHFFVAPVSGKCSKVVTFHDLSFERHPEFFSFKKRNWHNLLINPKREARRADSIIAVSKSTKEDLVDIYGVDSEKIKVVYPGNSLSCLNFKSVVDDSRFSLIKEKYNLPDGYILYFGTLEPRKNIKSLIKAFENLNSKNKNKPRYKLVIAGAKGWLYKDIIRAAENSEFCDDIFFPGYIEEQDKPYLYGLARVFVYPSFFEGFGFPPLEAMSSGVPTVVSYTSSLPEVVGNAALMVNPYNIDEITWAMEEVLNNQSLRETLIQRGKQRARRFSWKQSAEQVSKIIKSSVNCSL